MRIQEYQKGFLPYAAAAAVLSLCGGLAVALPSTVVSDWELAESTVSWLAMAYALGTATFSPIMGKAGDRIGRRRTLLLGLALLASMPLLSALAPRGQLLLLLLFRFLTGVGAAAVTPVVMAYIMTEFPQEKLGQGFTLYMLISCGMVIFGPALGSWLIAVFSWRAVMYICSALSALVLAGAFVFAKREIKTAGKGKAFDFAGAALVVLFVSMALSVPTFGQSTGWLSVPTWICLAVGALALVGLVLVEKRAESPILDGKFLFRKRFLLSVAVLLLSQGLLQSAMTNIITFSIVTKGSGTLSGIATSVMYLGMSLGTILIGPLADKREPRSVAAAALVLVALGAALQMLFTEDTGLFLMGSSMFLIGIGLGGNTTIFMKIVLSGLSPEAAGSGSGTYNVFRDIAAPFGVAVFVPMFSAGLVSGTEQLVAQGISAETARAQAAVEALHSTALAQSLSVAAGIALCFFLPKIHIKKDPEA